MIKGMDIETARRYIRTIEAIEEIVDIIHAIAYLMSTFSGIDDDDIQLKPSVIGYLGKRIAEDVLRITELLDDNFASRAELELELERIGNDD